MASYVSHILWSSEHAWSARCLELSTIFHLVHILRLPKTVTTKSKAITTCTKPTSTKRKQKSLKKLLQRLANPLLTWMGFRQPSSASGLLQPSSLQHKPTSGEDPKTPCPSPAGCLLGVATVGFCTHCFLLGPRMLLQTDPNCSEVVPVQDSHNRLLHCFHFLCF